MADFVTEFERSLTSLAYARRARALSRVALFYNVSFLVLLLGACAVLAFSGTSSTAVLCAATAVPAVVLVVISLRVFRRASDQVRSAQDRLVRAEVALAAPHDVLV